MEEYDKVVFSLYFPRKAAQSLTGRIIRLKSGASEVFITLLLLFLCHADITWLSAWACNSLDDYNTICDDHQPKTNLSYSESIFTELSVHKKKEKAGYYKSPPREWAETYQWNRDNFIYAKEKSDCLQW